MLYRKISQYIENHLLSGSDKILVIEGARQVGKSFIIRDIGRRLFPNFVEVNFAEDAEGRGLFRNVHTTNDFYFALSMLVGDKLGEKASTLVFLDEIQQYPQLLTLLKFLRQEGKFNYIASGSLLGITLRSTTSIPIGSIVRKEMFQLDFEEFLIANGYGQDAINSLREKFLRKESLSPQQHEHVMGMFRRYLLVGGMPDAVNEYIASHNIMKIRSLHESILSLYGDDASKYEDRVGKRLMIRRIYDMVPSLMENQKKRIVVKDIQGIEGDRFANYLDEFEYLVSSGIAIDVRAVSNPVYPLTQSVHKNLIKLYMNDVGMLCSRLYGINLMPVLNDESGVNLGSLYENAVARELRSHGMRLFYYDNRHKGEVDFMIDNNSSSSILPIEVKSGKDYAVHSALNNLLSVKDYNVRSAIVLSSKREIKTVGNITYLPVYHAMFISNDNIQEPVGF